MKVVKALYISPNRRISESYFHFNLTFKELLNWLEGIYAEDGGWEEWDDAQLELIEFSKGGYINRYEVWEASRINERAIRDLTNNRSD